MRKSGWRLRTSCRLILNATSTARPSGQPGEFALASFAVEDIVSPADFYVQSLEALLGASGVKRLILVPDEEAYGERVRRSLAGAPEGKEVTLLTMTPHPARGTLDRVLIFAHERLGHPRQ